MANFKPDPDAKPNDEGPMQPAGGPYVGRIEWAGCTRTPGKPTRILCRLRPVAPETIVKCAPLLVNLPAVGTDAQMKFLSVFCNAAGCVDGFNTEVDAEVARALQGRFVMYGVKHKPYQGVDKAELDRMHPMDPNTRQEYIGWWNSTHQNEPGRVAGQEPGPGAQGPVSDDDVPF